MVAILIADLVLLQAIWTVFKLVTDSILLRRHPEMKYCEGCLKSGAGQEGGSEALLVGSSGSETANRGKYIELRNVELRSPDRAVT